MLRVVLRGRRFKVERELAGLALDNVATMWYNVTTVREGIETKGAEMGKVYRFSKLSAAQSFQARAAKATMIILGDDGRYWVALLADAQRLLDQGYERA